VILFTFCLFVPPLEAYSIARLFFPEPWTNTFAFVEAKIVLLSIRKHHSKWQVVSKSHSLTEFSAPSSSIWPHLSYGLVRSKREYYH